MDRSLCGGTASVNGLEHNIMPLFLMSPFLVAFTGLKYCTTHSGPDVSSHMGVSGRAILCTCQRQQASVR